MPTSPDRSALLAALRSGQPLPDHLRPALSDYLRSKVPPFEGQHTAGVHGSARILRDRFGVPHIAADDPDDLFYAYGYATAQDRLWQLDYLRRAALGRLAAILGPDALGSDIEVRTVGIDRLAQQLEPELPAETAQALAAYAEGINAVIDASQDNLPIEFEILEYSCPPWSIADSLALMKHFWWQLTGRLFLITGPELLHRAIGDGPLWDAFLRSEVHGESILPPGENRARPLPPLHPIAPFEGGGSTAAGDITPPGSNNWVIGPGKSVTGHALFASDPHTPYGAPTVWYEVHLHGAGYNVAGMGYVGLPGIIFGRNPSGTWGITNNICSLRDLFVFRADDPSVPSSKHVERIEVRGGSDHVLNLPMSRLGPIVNHLLPGPIRSGPPVALRWVGTEIADEVGCMLRLNRAASVEDFRAALSEWVCPTFNFVWADRSGNIAYQTAGRLPRRRVNRRGLCSADDPHDQWAGWIPFEYNPWCLNPKQDWIGTANNPVLPAGEDPGLGGMFTSDARARRIRQKMQEQTKFTLKECADFQLDTASARAADLLPALITVVEKMADDDRSRTVLDILRRWDCKLAADSGAAAIFESFSRHWIGAVLDARGIAADLCDLITRHIFGVGFELLKADQVGWFAGKNRVETIWTALQHALDDLAARLGPDLSKWRWGDLHTITLKHPLGQREALAAIFNTGPRPIDGASHTVNNQWVNFSGTYEAMSGANCRVAADLGTDELLATNALGQSGHPGSKHYRDQFDDWLAGRLHVLSLDWSKVEKEATHRLELIGGK